MNQVSIIIRVFTSFAFIKEDLITLPGTAFQYWHHPKLDLKVEMHMLLKMPKHESFFLLGRNNTLLKNMNKSSICSKSPNVQAHISSSLLFFLLLLKKVAALTIVGTGLWDSWKVTLHGLQMLKRIREAQNIDYSVKKMCAMFCPIHNIIVSKYVVHRMYLCKIH